MHAFRGRTFVLQDTVKDFIFKNKDLKILIYSCFIDKLGINCHLSTEPIRKK